MSHIFVHFFNNIWSFQQLPGVRNEFILKNEFWMTFSMINTNVKPSKNSAKIYRIIHGILVWDSEIPPRGQNSRSTRRLGQVLDHDYWHWGGISLSHVSISWMIVFVTLFYITLKKFWQLSNLTFKSLLLVFSNPISISQNILSVLGFSRFEKKIITVWHMLPIHMGKKWFTLLPALYF